MIVISIDPGTYSLKYLISEHQKKNVTIVDVGEVVLSKHMGADGKSPHELHAKIIKDLKINYGEQAKINLLVPPELITSRFLTLPVGNKKKAEMMIPFQLDEELPFSSSEIHYSSTLTPGKDSTEAIISIIKKENFDAFFSPLREQNVLPYFLTSQLSVINNYKDAIEDDDFCILDLGHKTSKAYFFKNKELVSYHVSYVAGKTLTDAISKTYNIAPEEAIQYKHDNAFVLTTNQLAEVNDSQRKFASLMDEILSSLISDFKRWELGYRVSFTDSISRIYLTGGSSHIKNIESYLLENLNHPISRLSEHLDSSISLVEDDKYIYANLLSNSYSKRNKLGTFLTGEYAPESSDDLPLYSLSFLNLRIILVCFFIIAGFFVERFFINKQTTAYNKDINKLLQSPVLDITARDRRNFTSQPEDVLKKLQQKQKDMDNQEMALESLKEIDGLTPLMKLSNLASRRNITLDQFSSHEDKNIVAVFTPNEDAELEDLVNFKNFAEKQGLTNFQANINNRENKLTIRFYGD